MKRLLFIGLMSAFTIFFAGCNKSGCDDCVQQKHQFCIALYETNCNSAFLTTYIDNLIKACGTDEANNYISVTTQQCTQGTLDCPDECE
ncbi:MAG: hypothetical protein PHR81_01095 [Bacteroidales bacterium]|jgi:hypothetical protein|nr:hypothetical protein [Bacteroidales bacterium]MDD4213386.1 hypothetical protein [Bacteroidales bacterium]